MKRERKTELGGSRKKRRLAWHASLQIIRHDSSVLERTS